MQIQKFSLFLDGYLSAMEQQWRENRDWLPMLKYYCVYFCGAESESAPVTKKNLSVEGFLKQSMGFYRISSFQTYAEIICEKSVGNRKVDVEVYVIDTLITELCVVGTPFCKTQSFETYIFGLGEICLLGNFGGILGSSRRDLFLKVVEKYGDVIRNRSFFEIKEYGVYGGFGCEGWANF